MRRLRVVFFGRHRFSAVAVGTLHHLDEIDVVGVVQGDRWTSDSLPTVAVRHLRGLLRVESDVATVAWTHGIPWIRTTDVNRGAVVAWVRDRAPELCCIAGLPQLLRSPLLEIPRLGTLNLHPSLLPRYRGPAPRFWMAHDGYDHAGATVHWANLEADSGPIVLQESLPFRKKARAEDFEQTFQYFCARLLGRAVAAVARNGSALPSRPQGPGTWHPRPQPEDLEIDASLETRRIADFVRQLPDHYTPVLRHRGRRHGVDAARWLPRPRTPTRTTRVAGRRIRISWHDGSVELWKKSRARRLLERVRQLAWHLTPWTPTPSPFRRRRPAAKRDGGSIASSPSARVQITRLAALDPAEWELLDGHGLQTSYPWLRVLEETSRLSDQCWLLTIRDATGPLAALPCSLELPRDGTVGLDHILFGRLRPLAAPLGLSTLPSVCCGPGGGDQPGILLRRGLPPEEGRVLLHEVLSALEVEAHARGWTLYFRNLDPTCSLADVLRERGYLEAEDLPGSALEIRWGSFAGYRRALKRVHARTEKNIRNELNRLRRSGITIERIDASAELAVPLHALLDGHFRRLNGVPFPFRQDFLPRLRAALGDACVIYAAMSGGRPVAVLVAIRDRDRLRLPFIGLGRTESPGSLLYFNLGYNRPIRDAIEWGLRWIDFGRLHDRIKAQRGCELLPTRLFLRGRSLTHSSALLALLGVRSRRLG